MLNLKYMLTLPEMPSEQEIKDHSMFWLGYASGVLTLALCALFIYLWFATEIPL